MSSSNKDKKKKASIFKRMRNGSKSFGFLVMSTGELVKEVEDPSYSYRKEQRANNTKSKLKKPIKRIFTTYSALEKDGLKPGNRFDVIDEFIDTLSVIPDNLDKFFLGLEFLGQTAVDVACEDTSKFINKKLASIRDNLVNCLHDRYAGAMLLASKLEILKNPPTSPDAVVNYVTDFVDQHKWAQIIPLIYDFVTLLPPKLNKLIAALTKVASYRPPQMEVNLNKFHIEPPTLSIGDIIG